MMLILFIVKFMHPLMAEI